MKQVYRITIDTSKTDETTVLLDGKNIHKEKTIASTLHTSQHVLPLIEELCRETGISINDTDDIKVHTGPGSFTGLRVGACIGMTLGWVFGIPVNGKPANMPPQLNYGEDYWR